MVILKSSCHKIKHKCSVNVRLIQLNYLSDPTLRPIKAAWFTLLTKICRYSFPYFWFPSGSCYLLEINSSCIIRFGFNQKYNSATNIYRWISITTKFTKGRAPFERITENLSWDWVRYMHVWEYLYWPSFRDLVLKFTNL